MKTKPQIIYDIKTISLTFIILIPLYPIILLNFIGRATAKALLFASKIVSAWAAGVGLFPGVKLYAAWAYKVVDSVKKPIDSATNKN